MINPEVYLDNDNWICLDMETTNFSNGHAKDKRNRLLLTVLYGPAIGYKVVWANEYNLYKYINKHISNASYLIAHNAKFEYQWLARSGFKLEELPPVFCTQIAEYVLAGNRKWKLNLESTCKRHGLPGKDSLVSLLIKNGICPSTIDSNILYKYCKKDVYITYILHNLQKLQLKNNNLLKVFATESAFTPVAADLELTGMHLDPVRVAEEDARIKTELEEIGRELDSMTGGINMSSPKQVAEFVYGQLKFKEITDRRGKPIRGKPTKTFPDGQPKTDAPTLLALKATTQKQRKFIELKLRYAKLEKDYNTYISVYKETAENSNILMGGLNLTIAGTHRTTSSKPNMQNQPRAFKKLFNSRHKGWKIGEVDQAQLEFRVAGFVSKDSQLYEDVLSGRDAHYHSASVMLNKPVEEVTKEERTDAKADTFGPLFGKTSGTTAQKRYFEDFKKRYKTLTDVQTEWITKALAGGILEHPTGIITYWPNLEVSRSGYIPGENKIRNWRIQYFASAEIVKAGILFLWKAMKQKGMKSFLINTVHDSGIAEVHPDEEEEWSKLAKECMVDKVIEHLDRLYGIKFDMPLEVEVKVGDYWGE